MRSAAHQNADQDIWYQKLHKEIKIKTVVQAKLFMKEELETVSSELERRKNDCCRE